MGEFIVKIGSEFCAVESLNRDKLYCRPPENQPQAVSPSGGYSAALPMVEVIYHVLLSRKDYYCIVELFVQIKIHFS